MPKHLKRDLAFALIGVSAVLLVMLGVWWSDQRRGETKLFDGTTAIDLSYDDQDTDKVRRSRLQDPVKLRAIIEAVRLVPKPTCACKHWTKAIFTVGGRKIVTSMCGHCFDIEEGSASGTYQMPKPLLRELLKHIEIRGARP